MCNLIASTLYNRSSDLKKMEGNPAVKAHTKLLFCFFFFSKWFGVFNAVNQSEHITARRKIHSSALLPEAGTELCRLKEAFLHSHGEEKMFYR